MALGHGGSRSQLNSFKREPSTGQARGIQRSSFGFHVAASVRVPRDKPVASSTF